MVCTFVRHSNSAHGTTILQNAFSVLQTMLRLPESRKVVQQTNNKDELFTLRLSEVTCEMNQCNILRVQRHLIHHEIENHFWIYRQSGY